MLVDARRCMQIGMASALLALLLGGAPLTLPAQDTPEMLAAMRSHLPPVPEQVPPRDALPPELRAQLLPIAVETHRWHAEESRRFVILKGRRIEVDGVVDRDLWLREIRPDGVVLQFREHFYFLAR